MLKHHIQLFLYSSKSRISLKISNIFSNKKVRSAVAIASSGIVISVAVVLILMSTIFAEPEFQGFDHLQAEDFLDDFNFMMAELEASFPFFYLNYRTWGVDLHQLAEQARQVITDSGEIDVLDFYDILRSYFFNHINPCAPGRSGIGHLAMPGAGFTLPQINNHSLFAYRTHLYSVYDNHFNAFNLALHNDLMRPQTIAFYQELYYREHGRNFVMRSTHIPNNAHAFSEYHLQLESLEAGRIAYLGYRYVMHNWYTSCITETLAVSSRVEAFYEKVDDYEHLIIDLRGNSGGNPNFFQWVIMPALLNQNNATRWGYEYFTSMRSVVFYTETENNMRHMSRYFPEHLQMSQSVPIRRPGVNPVDFEQFTSSRQITWGVGSVGHCCRPQYARLQNATIWVLIDGETASAAEHFPAFFKQMDMAVLVGENTRGIPSSLGGTLFRAGISLPNSGIYITYDFGYLTDAFGNALEGYGVTPHYFNRPGMDALETVLAMIEEGNY